MVLCFVAMFVFGVMGIFSATHRKIAWEAFDCVFRKITFRKCQTGLDTKLKSQIVGKLLKFSPKTGRFVFKHFQIMSWLFTALFIWSMVATAIAGYNFYAYGNCNGPQEDGFCIFDPTGSNSKVSSVEDVCVVDPTIEKELTLEGVNLALFPHYNLGAKNEVVFIGCYHCEYTRDAYDNIVKLRDREDVEFTFAHFPVKGESDHVTDISNCVYGADPDKLKEFNDIIFKADAVKIGDVNEVLDIVESVGLDKSKIQECMNSTEINELRVKQFEELLKTNIYGTPLVFVNGEPVVGPKPYRVYKRLLD